mgnify:CR=1 FL=1
MQLTHAEHKAGQEKFPLILVTDNIFSEANIGSMFRLADAFNIEKIIFGGNRPNLDSNRLKKTARDTHRTVPFEFSEETTSAIKDLKEEGYRIFALEITSDSTPLEKFNFAKESKIVLLVGNERYGIEKPILDLSDEKIHIKMFGRNSSMNVAQAAGIAFYEITKSLLPFQKK